MALSGTAERGTPRFLALRVLAAQLVTQLGTGVTAVALPLLVYGSTGTLTNTSLVLLTGALPTVLFGLIGGAHADRVNRQLIVVAANIVIGIVLVAVPLSYHWGGLVAVAASYFLIRTLTAFSGPAFRASLPALFAEDLQGFFGKRTGAVFLAQTIGPAIGGLLVGVLGAADAIVVDGVSYLAFAALIASIRNFDPDRHARTSALRAVSTLRSIGAGLAHVRHNALALAMLGFWFVSLAALPISLLAAVPYLTSTLGRSSFEYGLAISGYAAASLVSSWLAGRARFTGGARRWMLVSGLGYGAVNLVMIFRPSFLPFCLLWIVWGLFYGPEEVVGQLAFAQAAPEEFQGRLYSLMTVVLALAGIVGTAVAGPLTDRYGPPVAMFIGGLGFLIATVGFFGTGPGARALARVQLGRPEPLPPT